MVTPLAAPPLATMVPVNWESSLRRATMGHLRDHGRDCGAPERV